RAQGSFTYSDLVNLKGFIRVRSALYKATADLKTRGQVGTNLLVYSGLAGLEQLINENLNLNDANGADL
ncbi:MAG: hypothetical protein AAF557_27425, partial [Pseudomonadota bacterium]